MSAVARLRRNNNQLWWRENAAVSWRWEEEEEEDGDGDAEAHAEGEEGHAVIWSQRQPIDPPQDLVT